MGELEPEYPPSAAAAEIPEHEDSALNGVTERLAAELGRRDKPTDLSPAALALLLRHQAEYVEDVGLAAIHLARRDRMDVVSASHIERAVAEQAPGAHGGRRVVVQTFAGAALGTGGSLLSSELLGATPRPLYVLVAVLLLVVGIVAAMTGRR